MSTSQRPAPAAPPRLGPAAAPLDVAAVQVLHDAVRASLRLGAGLDPGWTWSGHSESEFLRGVRGHHLSGLIDPHAAELGFPAALHSGITRNADRVMLRSLAQAGLLRQVHRRLEAAGIPALFFKGLAVEAQTGRELGDRGGGDIDLWVSPEHVEAAVETLLPEWTLPNNYPQPGPSWAWRHWLRWGSELPLVGPVTLDLHWHLHCVQGTLPDFAEAWAVREAVLVGGHAVPTLSRAHALAHACRHAETDHWRILRSLVDIHLLLSSDGPSRGDLPRVSLPGRTFAVVAQSIGLPDRWSADSPSRPTWETILDEQRHVGSHAGRIAQLPRSTYLRRVLARLRVSSRKPVHDALKMGWFLAMAPPQELGLIITPSTVGGVFTGLKQRVRHERQRLREDGAFIIVGRSPARRKGALTACSSTSIDSGAVTAIVPAARGEFDY